MNETSWNLNDWRSYIQNKTKRQCETDCELYSEQFYYPNGTFKQKTVFDIRVLII